MINLGPRITLSSEAIKRLGRPYRSLSDSEQKKSPAVIKAEAIMNGESNQNDFSWKTAL